MDNTLLQMLSSEREKLQSELETLRDNAVDDRRKFLRNKLHLMKMDIKKVREEYNSLPPTHLSEKDKVRVRQILSEIRAISTVMNLIDKV
jgi:hypothetical protein